MPRMLPLLLIAGATALSACAVSGTRPGQSGTGERQCFYSDRVDNFRGDNQTLYVRTRNKEVFELKTLGYCDNIDFAFGIAFLPNSGINRLCTGDLSRIIVAGGGTPRDQCRVQVVKKLTEAEVAALPSRDRP